MNKAIRAAVVERSGGNCEACYKWGGESLHFDHIAGRRNGESVESGWMLCPVCDHLKTTNSPSALKWVQRFMTHCAIYGYAEQVKKCQLRLDWLVASGRA